MTPWFLKNPPVKSTAAGPRPTRVKMCAALALLALAGCAGGPPVPNWQLDVKAAQRRAQSAQLEGRAAVANVEWDLATQAARTTGQPEVLLTLWLSECALRTAMLDVSSACPAPRAGDVLLASLPDHPALSAYHAYVLGRSWPTLGQMLPQASAADRAPAQAAVEALPAQHRPVVRWLAGQRTAVPELLGHLQAMTDPVARLVALGALARAGVNHPMLMALAVDTASAQGWAQPLAAWSVWQIAWQRQQPQPDEAVIAQAERRLSLMGLSPAGIKAGTTIVRD